MRTGELAKRAGVNIQTLRFYEREQLLRKPSRTASGYRSYDERDLWQVNFIRECQHLGFTLKEIQQLDFLHRSIGSLKNPATDRRKFVEVMSIVKERLEVIEQKIQSLQKMREQLFQMLEETRGGQVGGCPVHHAKS